MVLPALYVAAILAAVFFGSGRSVGAVAAIGAVLLGAYWAGIRRNLS